MHHMADTAPEDPQAEGVIHRIAAAVTHRICAGQVIVDLATGVKELVENALDAGATTIEVRLQDYGAKLIEVADNGCGIAPADYDALAKKYTTSKLARFNDLMSLATYGFRGEALSSLCAVGELSVVTRQAEQQAGACLEYDHEGSLTKCSPVARAPGTTVALRNLFASLPVRHKDLQRNVRREFGKMVAVLQAYALVCTHVRFNVTNQVAAGHRATVLSTQGPRPSASLAPSVGTPAVSSAAASPARPASATETDMRALSTNIITVLGPKVADTLEPLEVEVPDLDAKISGYVSRGTGPKAGGESARQFVFLNHRPVDLPKVVKTLNESYRSLTSAANQSSKPTAVLNIRLPPDVYDINITPDKRKALVQQEAALVAALKQALEALWEPSRFTYALNSTQAGAQGAGRASGASLGASALAGGGPRPRAVQRPLTNYTQSAGRSSQPPEPTVSPLPQSFGSESAGRGDTSYEGSESQPGQAPQGSPRATEREPLEESAAGALLSPQHDGSSAAPPPLAGRAASAAHAAHRQPMSPPSDAGMKGRSAPSAQSPPTQLVASPSRDDVDRVPDSSGAPTVPPSTAVCVANVVHSPEPDVLGFPARSPSVSGGARSAQQPQQGGTPAAGLSAPPSGQVRPELLVSPRPSPLEGSGIEAGACGEGGASGSQGRLPPDASVPSPQAPPRPGARQSLLLQRLTASKAGRHAGAGASRPALASPVLPSPPNVVPATRNSPTRISLDETEGEEHEQEEEREGGQQLARGAVDMVHILDGDSSLSGGGRGQRQRQGDVNAPSLLYSPPAVDMEEGSDDEVQVVDISPEQRQQAAPGCQAAPAVEAPPQAVAVRDVAQSAASQPPIQSPVQSPTQPPTQQPSQPPSQQSTQARGPVLACDMARLTALVQARIRSHTTAAMESMGPVSAPATSLSPAIGLQQQEHPCPDATDGSNGGGEAVDSMTSPVRAAKRRRRQFVSASLQGGEEASGAVAGAVGGTGTRAEQEAAAERELERVFDKADFRDMQVIGQFNLGFILARLGQDVFIIDQHAADEKRTFERLQANVVLGRQPLLGPRPLDLPYLDEMVVRDHLDSVFRRNGFDCGDDPATGALMLTAVPHCRGVLFGPDDVRELVTAIREGGVPLASLRPSRVRAILASRACRSSIMIGRALEPRQMTRLVHSLADLDAPWNCPHGRPTMRHACVLPLPSPPM